MNDHLMTCEPSRFSDPIQLLQVAELMDEHHGIHAQGLGVELIVAFRHLIEIAVDGVVSLRELTQPDIDQGC